MSSVLPSPGYHAVIPAGARTQLVAGVGVGVGGLHLPAVSAATMA
jgi:hypothetical protein